MKAPNQSTSEHTVVPQQGLTGAGTNDQIEVVLKGKAITELLLQATKKGEGHHSLYPSSVDAQHPGLCRWRLVLKDKVYLG